MVAGDVGNGIDLRLLGTEIVRRLLGGAEVVLVEEDMMTMNLVDDLDRENFLPVELEVEEHMAVEMMILAGEEDTQDPEVRLQGDTDRRLLHDGHRNRLKSLYLSRMILIGMFLVGIVLISGRTFIM